MTLSSLKLLRSALPGVLGWAVLLAAPAGLRASDWQSLLANTPFGQSAAATTGAPGELEFRGVVQEEGVYFVNLFNPATKTSQWIEVNAKVAGLEIKSYDANSDKVQIVQDGRPLTLTLKQARVALLQPTPPPAAPKDDKSAPGADRRAEIRDMIRARMENGGGNGQPFMRNLPPEAQAMIEEFRRRRAGNTGGPQAQTQTPAPAPAAPADATPDQSP